MVRNRDMKMKKRHQSILVHETTKICARDLRKTNCWKKTTF
jgi:hypothetical protein